MTAITTTRSRATRLLLIGCSSLALATSAAANDVIFTSLDEKPTLGERTVQPHGVSQVALTGGGIVSISDAAEYTINADGSIDLHRGSITVTGADAGSVIIRMPDGLEASVTETSSASFSVAEDGEASGHTLTGEVMVGQPGRAKRSFRNAMMWTAAPGRGPRRSIATNAIAQPTTEPDEVAAIGDDAGPVGAAMNGIPVTLGDGLAGAGASADIIAAGRRVEESIANPTLETFPVDDLALLVAAAARLEGAYGGQPFNGAQADVIRTYLLFLASGASGADFLTTYSAFLVDYLDLIRAGGVPSGFADGVASAATIEAYLAYIARTGAISNLAASDRALADAYLAFIASGANRDLFATSLTDLTLAYFAFLRAGGAPADFTGASQDALAQSIAFLAETGVLAQLNAVDRALVEAFLANGGIAFAAQYRTALDDYFAFLAAGRLPSDYTALDQGTLRAYLETLSNTGLLETVLADQAQFYADYLAFLRAGGDVDAFAGLPANIFSGYAIDLQAYFEFLSNGGVPSAYTVLSQDTLQEYLAALQAAGANDRFLGDLAEFYQAYFQFIAGGGNPDNFAGLPVPPDFPAFAAALNAYAAFLTANGLPSDYTEEDIAQLQAFFNSLLESGQLNDLVGENAALLNAYFVFLSNGGEIDGFAGLPIYLDYVAALNAYFDFLAAGNLPSDYTVLDAATLEAYLAALAALQGGLAGVADLNAFFVDYFAFIQGGNDPDLFAGLPGGNNGGGNGTGSGTFADFTPPQRAKTYISAPGRTGSVTVANAEVDGQGALSGDNFTPGTARIANVGGDARGVVGTYRDGTFSFDGGQSFVEYGPNDGLHYVTLLPIVGALPQAGTIDYDIIAASAPTYDNGSTAPGTFAANLTVGFGASLTYGIDGSITMPDATYTFASPGRTNGDLAAPQASDPAFFVIRPILTGPGQACEAGQNCIVNLFGTFGGEEPQERVGFAYETFNQTIFDAPRIKGAVIFGAEGTIGDGGGNMGGTPPGNYTGGFSAAAANSVTAYAYSLNQAGFTIPVQARTPRFGGTNFGVTPNQHIIDENGGLARIQGSNGETVIDRETALNVDIAGDADLLIGRWTDGRIVDGFGGPNGRYTLTANQGFHYFLARGLENPVSVVPGLVTYTLAHATQPTLGSGRSAPGVFNANLAIEYGAAPKLGIDGTIVFEGTSGFTYTFATNGGAAAPSKEISFSEPSAAGRGGFFSFTSDTGSTNTGLDGLFGATGSLGKADGSDVAIGYTVDLVPRTGFQGESIAGAAIFRSEGGATAGGGNTGSGGNTGTGFTGTRDGIVYYTYTNGSLASGFGGSADLGNGALTKFTSILGTVDIASAEAVEAGDVGTMAWARWTNGTVEARTSVGNIDSVLGTNGGYHVMAGTASTSLPASGTINYELIGTTSATDNLGSAPGTTTGDLAIAFGSISKVGFDLAMNVSGRGYSVATTGGAANPGASQTNVVLGSGGPTFSAAFNSVIPGSITGSGGACVSSCQVSISGALYGANASHAGVAINVFDGGSGVQASGLAIFASPGASGTGLARSATAIAPSAPPIGSPTGSGDWSRWTGSGGPAPTGGAGAGWGGDAIAVMGDTLAQPVGANMSATTRAQAIASAEQLLGGTISWTTDPGMRP